MFDSFSIINASSTTVYIENGFTNYWIDYEYKVNDKFLYFSFGIKEQNGQLTVISFDGRLMDNSLSKEHAFTFENIGISHYIFLGFVILIPIFIIITLVFAIGTKIKKKWLTLAIESPESRGNTFPKKRKKKKSYS